MQKKNELNRGEKVLDDTGPDGQFGGVDRSGSEGSFDPSIDGDSDEDLVIVQDVESKQFSNLQTALAEHRRSQLQQRQEELKDYQESEANSVRTLNTLFNECHERNQPLVIIGGQCTGKTMISSRAY